MTRTLRMSILIGILALLPIVLTPPAIAQGETVIASDNFNRADESPFAVGLNWGRTIAGNYDGVSNLTNGQVTSVSNEGIYYWQGAGSFSPTRQFARQRVVQKDGELGLVLLGGPGQAIMIGWGPPGVGSTVYIYWYSGGIDRGQLATGPSTLANGDIIEAVLDGGIISAKVNGVTVKSVANSTTLTSGNPGFITYLDTGLPSQVAILDDWEAGTPASYTISGTITENAAGLSGVLVTASGGASGSTTTTGTGAYAITGVPSNAASVVLTPTLAGHTMNPLTRTVVGPIAADVSGQDFTSTLNSGATLTIQASHGSVTRDPDQATYTSGTNVTLTPIPDAGYDFASWSGDVPAGHALDDPLIVTMDQDRTITAQFTAPNVVASDDFNRPDETPFVVGGNWQKALSTGSVNLTSNRVAGDTGDALYYWQGAGTFDSTRQFARSRVVQPGGQVGLVLLGASNQGLAVAWNAGALYIYWYSGGSNQGQLTTASSTLQAGDVIEALLENGTVYAKINGAIVASAANTTTLSSGRPGFETYLTGASFDDWEAGTPQSFTISGTITESSAGLGGVQVTASGGFGGAATTNGNGLYAIAGVPLNATSIILTPALAGHTMSPLTRTVNGPVTDNVSGEDFTSTLNTSATLTIFATHGSVTRDPDQVTYAYGTDVTLTAVPDAGHNFAGWSGDVPAGHETDNPLHVTMNQDRTITANFIAPDVVAWDYFDRPNESPLAVGGNWQRLFAGGLADLANHHVQGASGDALYFWQGVGTFDGSRQFARARVVQASGQLGLVLLGGSDRALVVAWNAGTLYVYWYSGGSNQGPLTTASSTLQAGDIIEALLDGGTVYAKINGSIVASAVNTTTLPWGQPGFETYLTGGQLDDWEAGPPPATGCTPEICDGLDNDCNGFVDDGATLCNDGNSCTSDVCQGGVCVNSPLSCNDNNVCTDDSCNPATGCVFVNNTASCNDGSACTTADACSAGACVGTAVVCNDNNVCTDDSCNPATGCVFVNNTAACSDGNSCTSDVCGGGVCVSTPLSCDDNNACTNDSCNPATGCVHVDNTAACNDGNACTTGDVCSGGTCTGATPVVCNDSNVCTNDSCNPATGCVFVNNTAPCNDGNACTTADTCSAGACVGTALSCNDNNVCTNDSCNPTTGCVHVNNTVTCNDGNACTTGDVCQGGNCVGVAVPPPAEIQGLTIDAHPTKLNWTALSGVMYDVASASVSSLRVSATTAATCLANDRTSANYNDSRADPPANDGYYYMVRAQATCGAGTYGYRSGGLERLPAAACP